jgi:hypothetical protein
VKSVTEKTSSVDSVTVRRRTRASRMPSGRPRAAPPAPRRSASPSTRRATCRRSAPTQRRMPICWRRAATDVATALPTTKIAARSARPESPERSVWNECR